MPETISGYELFQLCAGKDPDETIGFAEYVSDLGEDGNSVSVLYGADTGRRSWKINFPVLPGAQAQASVTVGGVTMTPEAYLWDLFCRSKVSGLPFVIQSPRNDQYYLARFADRELTYTRMVTKLYSAGIGLKQVRIPGVTVFDPLSMAGLWGLFGPEDNFTVDQGPLGHDLVVTGNVTNGGTTQNGLATTRFNNGATNTGFLNTSEDPVIKEAFFIMKMNEATFSNNAGILTAGTSVAALAGDTGKTTFYNLAFGSTYEYRKDGILYAETNQQAPMNAFGLVHIRFQTGWGLINLQIGKDRDFAGRFAEADMGQMLLFTTLQPMSDSLELAEHLQTKWNI